MAMGWLTIKLIYRNHFVATRIVLRRQTEALFGERPTLRELPRIFSSSATLAVSCFARCRGRVQPKRDARGERRARGLRGASLGWAERRTGRRRRPPRRPRNGPGENTSGDVSKLNDDGTNHRNRPIITTTISRTLVFLLIAP